MNIVVFGATGAFGSRIVEEALERGHHVRATARDPRRVRLAHERLEVRRADVCFAAEIAEVAAGQDCAVSAVGGAREGNVHVVVDAARALVDGLRTARVRRLVVVGGAGTLQTAGGHRLVDDPEFPEAWKPSSLAQAEALDVYRASGETLDWTFVSPAHERDPGARTGRYRLGGDQLLVDDEGHSRISVEDFAVALVDEIEWAAHPKQRISVAY